jgi:hypothetical protein
MMRVLRFEAEAGSGEAAVDEGGLVLDFPQSELDGLEQAGEAGEGDSFRVQVTPAPGTRG